MNQLSTRHRALPRELVFTILACLASMTSVAAHEFWIVPSSFTPETGERVAIEFRVGEHWTGDAVPRNSDKIARFVALHADGREESVLGIEAKSPAGFMRSNQPELMWLGYESRPTPIELAAEKFESYLAAEGLEHVIEARKQRGASGTKGREIYSRSVKSLLRVGAPAQLGAQATASDRSGIDRRLGLPLEILVEQNPYEMNPGDKLAVRVEFEGKPLTNALVGCASRTDAIHDQRARTDKDGRVVLTLDHSDAWLVRVVHMIPASADEHADWRSYWASLTFELPERAKRP
jgi:uncharacterized GH25 family protein